MEDKKNVKGKLTMLLDNTESKSNKKAPRNKKTKSKTLGKLEMRKAEKFPAMNSVVKFKVHGLSSRRGGKFITGEVIKQIVDSERQSKFVEIKDKNGNKFHKRVSRIVALDKQ